MKNINNLLTGLTDQLRNNAVLSAKGYNVKQGVYINRNPDIEPWVGVYKGKRNYTPATLGHDLLQWDNSITVMVVVQAAFYGDGDLTDELLEERIKEVLDAVNGDHTIGGQVDMLNDISIEYSYVREDSSTILFQEATINLIYEISGDG